MMTPSQIVEFIYEEELDQEFVLAIMSQVDQYSIGEVPDKELSVKDGKCHLSSRQFHIETDVVDDEIYTAVNNGLYVTVFLSRHKDSYGVHFLTHQYPISMKPQFEKQILDEVIRYMIFKTVLALKLDTKEKVIAYVNRTYG